MLPSCQLPSLRARRWMNGRVSPVMLIVLALVIAALVFFLVTKPAMEKKQAEVAQAQAEVAEKEAAATKAAEAAAAPAKAAMAPPSVAEEKPATPPPTFGFARPLDLGKEMVRSLAAGEFARAGSLVAAADPTQAADATAMLEKMVKDLGAKIGTEDQVEILGMVENKTRVAVPFTLPGSTSTTPLRLQLDLERDERMGWKITRFELPQELAAALPVTPAPTAPMTANPSAPGAAPKAPGSTAAAPTSPAQPPANAARKPLIAVSKGDDALSFGSDFVRALLRHDFAEARKFVDEKRVPAERLAGLCIVFEEGQYEFKPTKPMIITVANPEVSWVIAQVQSPSLQQSTEFGLELQRAGQDQPWRVVGLNLSEILSSFAASASKMGVPYTPIVKNPSGGESLALYFEYDQAQLHPRAQKQLEIVAGLLKSDPNKKLHIAGHTDAKGTDSYNIRLSRSRADTVKEQLVGLGVAEAQIITTGLGKAQPLSPNEKADGSDDPQGRSKNRRAEIYLDF
ncbi:OmpA family protein [Brevifollis gellanilyticus]|nr:OmpA family protein [Brevifollis gellanilyticus]